MAKPSMPCIVTKVDDGFNFKLIGGTSADLDSIQEEINRVVAARPRKVYLDLSACEFMGSAGMGVLVHFQSQIRASDQSRFTDRGDTPRSEATCSTDRPPK